MLFSCSDIGHRIFTVLRMASKFLLGVPDVRFSCHAIQKVSQDVAEV
jgi:hypothetical protein